MVLLHYDVSQLMGLRYSPEQKQNLVQNSNSIQTYHMMNYALIDVALELVRNPLVLVYMYIFVGEISLQL